MFFGTYLQELLAVRSPFSLLLIVSVLATIGLLVKRSFATRPDVKSTIPLYVPKTVAAGNYKKRWSYDNPNVLREAYGKVGYRRWLFHPSTHLLLHSFPKPFSRYGPATGTSLLSQRVTSMN